MIEDEAAPAPTQGDACNEVETANQGTDNKETITKMIETQPTTFAHEEAKTHAQMLVQIMTRLEMLHTSIKAAEKKVGKINEKGEAAEKIGKALVKTKTALTQQRAIADLKEKHEKEKESWLKQGRNLRNKITGLQALNQDLNKQLQQALMRSQIQQRSSGTIEMMKALEKSTENAQKPAKKWKSTKAKAKTTETPKKKTKTAEKSPKEKMKERGTEKQGKTGGTAGKKKSATISKTANTEQTTELSPPRQPTRQSWG